MPMSVNLGLVLMPDSETKEMAIDLSRRCCRKPMDYLVTLPHISLYHATVQRVPPTFLLQMLDVLTPIVGTTLEIDEVTVFGGRFLFWEVRNCEMLTWAHEQSLALSGFLDRTKMSAATQEELQLDGEEIANVAMYGYPLVRQSYKPHITLCYRKAGFEPDEIRSFRWNAKVESVQAAHIGPYGSIARLLPR